MYEPSLINDIIFMWIYFFFPALLAYALGSIPFGYIFVKIFSKEDIRLSGSGNIGATNVLRTKGKLYGLATLIFDLLKGLLPVLFISSGSGNGTWIYGAFGLFIIIGHCFPVWLKFKGGKGVATALGVLLAAVPFAGLAACGVWLALAFLFKISSLAALIAIGSAPIVTFFIYGGSPAVVCLLIALLVFWRHKENIQRLLKGIEPKIGAK